MEVNEHEWTDFKVNGSDTSESDYNIDLFAL